MVMVVPAEGKIKIRGVEGRRRYSGCVEGDGGVGGEGWYNGSDANRKTKEMWWCTRIANTSVDGTLFQIEARFHRKKVFPYEKIHGGIGDIVLPRKLTRAPC